MSHTIVEKSLANGLTSGREKVTAKWFGSADALHVEQSGIRSILERLDESCYVVRDGEGRIGLANRIGGAKLPTELESREMLATLPAFLPEQLGDPAFKKTYGLRYNYMAGAMANGIASAELVIALGKAGMLSSFGAGGLVPQRIVEAIDKIQAGLPNGPYAFNLIHSPNEEALEREATSLFLERGIKVIEASAFMSLTPNVVRYRAAGLSRNADGSIHIGNRIIAKISRLEVAAHFMQAPPKRMLDQLVSEGLISAEQAELAALVPMADDITVEADSGGHTDNRPLACLLPSIIRLRDELQAKYQFPQVVRVGAAGGISTPESVFAAFMMGAAYVVTGSVNQACRESGTSDHVRKVLAKAGMTDIMMAPASDMFELGVKLQVLKKGSLFGLRAQKLYDYYIQYGALEEIPEKDRQSLEKTIFKASLDEIWQECIRFFDARDPEQIRRAENNPKRKMALVFRWYLGLSSSWANRGVGGREMDYQIWCGPAMGAFNQWVKGTRLEDWQQRYVADVGEELLKGAAYLYRLQYLVMQDIQFDAIYKQVHVK
ncbi:MAG: PfaD family polyunsaturated fatty acid/polyketide biosynthesis protein [Bacteroidota bacterium]